MEASGPADMAEVMSSPFVRSWVARARPGDQVDPDQSRRVAAWAHWALTALTPMTGYMERSYVAFVLPGVFYDPKGTGPKVRPHLEVPAWRWGHPDPLFPDRLAAAGNALMFKWWVMPEVSAVRRSLLQTSRGDAAPLLETLTTRTPGLVSTLEGLTTAAAPVWHRLQEQLVTDPRTVSAAVISGFTPAEVVDFFPAAEPFHLRIVFDEKLADGSQMTAARRIGVWTLRSEPPGEPPVKLAAVTPRLTASGVFTDPMFRPAGDGAASVLVRSLLLRRLLQLHSAQVPDPVAKQRPPRLRVIPARQGEKVPEASVTAAVKFLQRYPNAADAWNVLSRWAQTRDQDGAPRAVLTVTAEGFAAAHRAAHRAVRRAESPDRDDINVVLPLAWERGQRVVRLTFSAPDHRSSPPL